MFSAQDGIDRDYLQDLINLLEWVQVEIEAGDIE